MGVDAWAEKMRKEVDERQRKKLEASESPAMGKTAKKRGGAPDELVRLAEEEPESQIGWHAWQKTVKDLESSKELNESQRSAVIAALSRRLTLIQGPPGTGKTHVSVRLLELCVRKLWIRPLIATSDSNVAVDNIVEGLLERGIKVVRVGQAEKVRSHLDSITLEAMLRKRRADMKEAERTNTADDTDDPEAAKWKR